MSLLSAVSSILKYAMNGFMKKVDRNYSISEPIQIYKDPLLTSHEVSDWRKDEPLPVNEPWFHVPRRMHRNSEMTRSVIRRKHY